MEDYVFYMGYPGLTLCNIPKDETIEVIASKICGVLGCELQDLTCVKSSQVGPKFQTSNETLKLQRFALVLFLRKFKSYKCVHGVYYKKQRFSAETIGPLLNLKHTAIKHIFKTAENLLDSRFGYQPFKDIWKKLEVITSEELQHGKNNSFIQTDSSQS